MRNINLKTLTKSSFLMSAFLLVSCLSNSDDYYQLKKQPEVKPVTSRIDSVEDGTTECQNNYDDDGDKYADCDDPGCLKTAACLDGPLEDSYTLCKNGQDDDGDWLVDCADPQCQTTDACKGPIVEDAQSLCKNGLDDDNDGLVDCKDPQCLNTLACMDEQPEDSYTLCKNGKDDDKDGLADCSDPQCLLTQACPFISENTQALCTDRVDNDGKDGTDCADPKCATVTACQENTALTCNDKQDNDSDGKTDCVDPDCGSTSACLGEGTEALCKNGKDDDGDTKIDCADESCTSFMHCVGESTLSQCTNTLDDDNDGAKDCADTGCKPLKACTDTTQLKENNFLLCKDGLDNDADGLKDCLDQDCKLTEACLPESNCTDKLDNDQDGLEDCNDPNCLSNAVCMMEINCVDGQDNDKDGLADCADIDCMNTKVCPRPIPAESTVIIIGEPGGGGGDRPFPALGDKEMIIINNCPFPLWMHPVGAGQIVEKGIPRKVLPRQKIVYPNVPNFGGGRVYAYYKDPAGATSCCAPVNDYNQFVEMTFDDGVNYNISYVDYISLPVTVRGNDGRCSETKCSYPVNDWNKMLKDRCPHELDHQYTSVYTDSITKKTTSYDLGVCTGSYMWCMEGNDRDHTNEYCTKMEKAYSGKYPGHPEWKFTGAQLYGGVTPNMPNGLPNDGAWNQVAAWNRGSDPGEERPYLHYREDRKPYNDYAKMIHKDLNCKAYGFSTDDHQDQGGFYRCTETKGLTITWCPDDVLPTK